MPEGDHPPAQARRSTGAEGGETGILAKRGAAETVYPFRPRGKAPSLPALAGHKRREARKAQPIEQARAREWRSCRFSMPFSGVGNRLRFLLLCPIH